MKLGSFIPGNNKCSFNVWAPRADNLKLKLCYPEEKILPMIKGEKNYWNGVFANLPPGTKYYYRINDTIDLPDPASNYQPDGVHGPSEIVDHSLFKWDDENWTPHSLEDYIIYELHIGTFTKEGTFNSAIDKIPHLLELGITTVEIMPIAQFPGKRNWGYDGVYPFAPQNSYGGPAGLKNLVNALHNNNIAVILDVVYNHLGPEGNYLNQYAPYFSKKYHTGWGDAVNFDGEYSDEVRNYFIENALYWFEYYHFDGLRLDAIDKIYDSRAKHFLAELAERIHEYSEKTGLKKILIAESDLNDEKIIRPLEEKGFGLDAQWSDDFHHSLHSLLTGERNGYYADFGKTDDLVKSIKNSFVYDGIYSAYRKRSHGNDVSERELHQFIICLQNHDQIGNRAYGERISELISFEQYKLASALLLMSPYIPLLFMGQDIHENSPFLYFVSHADQDLIKSVREGRRKEYNFYKYKEDIPDPFSPETFIKSGVNWELLNNKKNKVIFLLYQKLISLRKYYFLPHELTRRDIIVKHSDGIKVILVYLHSHIKELFYIMNFEPQTVTAFTDIPNGSWKKVLDTSSFEWLGPGVSAEEFLTGKEQNIILQRESFVLYETEL